MIRLKAMGRISKAPEATSSTTAASAMIAA